MALLLSPETYERLANRFGKEEAKEIVTLLEARFKRSINKPAKRSKESRIKPIF